MPQFYRPPSGTLIKARQPMEQLSMDFKGPLSSASQNTLHTSSLLWTCYHAPFFFPCSNMNSLNVIKCLNQLFTHCGCPSYVHSDYGLSFQSKEVKNYLTQREARLNLTTLLVMVRLRGTMASFGKLFVLH